MLEKTQRSSSIILLIIALLSSHAATANANINMKSSVIAFAKIEYQKIKKNPSLLPQQRLYQLSMPLLAMATLKEEHDYEKILADMTQILSDESTLSQIEKPWQLWMMGRMALASKLAGNKHHLKKIKEKLSRELFENDSKDVISGWAFAYLAALDEESYQACREKLFEYNRLQKARYLNNPKDEASNYVWTLVMNLYASANAGKADYRNFLDELSNVTKKKTLEDTSLLVPESDYRQWLVSLERYSFTLTNDRESLNELKAINKPTVDSFDSMLSWANTWAMSPSIRGFHRFHLQPGLLIPQIFQSVETTEANSSKFSGNTQG